MIKKLNKLSNILTTNKVAMAARTEIEGKDLPKNVKYYKFLHSDFKHFDFVYQEGRNVDIHPWSSSSILGLYFCDEKAIEFYIGRDHKYVADVEIEDDAKVCQNGDVYRANKITIKNIRELKNFEEFENINICARLGSRLIGMEIKTKAAKIAIAMENNKKYNVPVMSFDREWLGEEYCKYLIEKDAISCISNPTTDMIIMMLKTDHWIVPDSNVYKMLQNASGNFMLRVIRECPRRIGSIKNMPEIVKYKLLKRSALYITYIDEPSADMYKLVAQNCPSCITSSDKYDGLKCIAVEEGLIYDAKYNEEYSRDLKMFNKFVDMFTDKIGEYFPFVKIINDFGGLVYGGFPRFCLERLMIAGSFPTQKECEDYLLDGHDIDIKFSGKQFKRHRKIFTKLKEHIILGYVRQNEYKTKHGTCNLFEDDKGEFIDVACVSKKSTSYIGWYKIRDKYIHIDITFDSKLLYNDYTVNSIEVYKCKYVEYGGFMNWKLFRDLREKTIYPVGSAKTLKVLWRMKKLLKSGYTFQDKYREVCRNVFQFILDTCAEDTFNVCVSDLSVPVVENGEENKIYLADIKFEEKRLKDCLAEPDIMSILKWSECDLKPFGF